MGAFQIYISRRIFPMNPGIMAFQSVLTELSNEHLKLNMLQNKFLVFLCNLLPLPASHISANGNIILPLAEAKKPWS